MPGLKIDAAEIANPFRDEIKRVITEKGIRPKLVGFLANSDPAAKTYADLTARTCAQTGLQYELKEVDKEDLENSVVEANEDSTVHGIIIYYPVFGDRQDQYLQNVVSEKKDVEGLSHKYVYNMYHNIRYLDAAKHNKCIIPCTPLAVVKVLEHIGVYNRVLTYGNRLHGRIITVINRSEVVGRPLAALLANDGAKVYSVDVNNIKEYHRDTGLKLFKHEVNDTDLTLETILSLSDVVVTGVPSTAFKIQTHQLKDGVVAINFSSCQNFDDNITERAALYAPAIGKVTIAMLERNLLRLFEYYNQS